MVILVFFIATAAMVADFYFGDSGASKKSVSSTGTAGPPPVKHPLKTSPSTGPAQTVDHGTAVNTKKPLQGLRQKFSGGTENVVGDGAVSAPAHQKPVPDDRFRTVQKEHRPVYEVF